MVGQIVTAARVTIAIPTFNRADQLRRSLASAIGQTYQDIEVIVCDNASTDHTRDVVNEVTAVDGRVRYLRAEINQGPGANFARALEVAMGEYFMWLADDDWLEPEFVSSCIKRLEQDPAAVVANGHVRYHNTDGSIFAEPATVLESRSPARRILRYYRVVARNGAFYGLSPTEARRRSPLDETLASDWVHVAALACQGKVVAVPEFTNRSAEGVSTLHELGWRSYALPIARHASSELFRSPAFGHLRRPSRVAVGAIVYLVVSVRLGILGRGLGPVSLGAALLRGRISPAAYGYLRGAYRRARFRRLATVLEQDESTSSG